MQEPELSDEPFWPEQKRRLNEALEMTIPAGAPAVLLDYPVYLNVGDLLIFLGTESWIDHHRLEVLGRWNIHDFAFSALPREAVILCQGGGNFGDLYPFQEFRESVVRAYPQNRIVFLPQTIHYESLAAKRVSARTLNDHGDLHLLLRDHQSMSLADESFSSCNSVLAPDMSAFLYPTKDWLGEDRASAEKQGVLYLLRRDREERSEQVVPQLGEGWEGDWSDLLGHRRWRLRILKAEARLLGKRLPSRAYAARWTRAAEHVARYCARRFLSADTVVTTRLHGHLLASLLGVPSLLLDNSYGKNSNYYWTWFREPCRSQPSGYDSR